MADGEQKVAEAVRKVFSVADIPVLGNTVGKRWVTIREWGGADVCVWGTTLADRARIEGDAALAEGNLTQAAIRRQVAAIIECARDGEAADAARIFERTKHWAWLEEQPASVLDALYSVVQDLDVSGSVTGVIEQAFGIPEMRAEIGQLRSCLSFIASHSGYCTDCQENSPETCPLQPST